MPMAVPVSGVAAEPLSWRRTMSPIDAPKPKKRAPKSRRGAHFIRPSKRCVNRKHMRTQRALPGCARCLLLFWQMLTTWLRDVVDALWSCVTPAPDGHGLCGPQPRSASSRGPKAGRQSTRPTRARGACFSSATTAGVQRALSPLQSPQYCTPHNGDAPHIGHRTAPFCECPTTNPQTRNHQLEDEKHTRSMQ